MDNNLFDEEKLKSYENFDHFRAHQRFDLIRFPVMEEFTESDFLQFLYVYPHTLYKYEGCKYHHWDIKQVRDATINKDEIAKKVLTGKKETFNIAHNPFFNNEEA